ncbi:hypothetical protein B0H13DRAFT_1875574 [Mycena leptocephala]|nr:hypothetical protein B0H13DRAFT_1875574 [Mycena leptocephala]
MEMGFESAQDKTQLEYNVSSTWAIPHNPCRSRKSASDGSDAATLAPTKAINFNFTGTPPDSSGGQMVFNWNDEDGHHAIDTGILMLTDGGNSSLADNSTVQYVIEALAMQFNKTHFTQSASLTPWVAIFSCTIDSPAGSTSDLIANAEKLGAHAILINEHLFAWVSYHRVSLLFPFIYTYIPTLTPPPKHSTSQMKFYDATAMNNLASNLTADFAALRSNSSSLTQTLALLARIPAIAGNVTAAAEALERQAPTKSPSAAARMRIGMGSGLGIQVIVAWACAWGNVGSVGMYHLF